MSIAPRRLALLAVGTLTMLSAGLPARAEDATPAAKTGAVAYPANPSDTPQAGRSGAPVATDRAACPAGTTCPDAPNPPGATAGVATDGAVKTPATAYPNSPDKTPAAEPTGTAPK